MQWQKGYIEHCSDILLGMHGLKLEYDRMIRYQIDRDRMCATAACAVRTYIIPQCIHQNVGSKGQKKLCWLSVLPDCFLADNAALNASSWNKNLSSQQ